MKWFLNLRISVKLLSAFILIALIAGAVGVVGVVNLKTIEGEDTRLYNNMTVPINILADIATDFQQVRVSIRDTIYAATDDEMNAQIKNIADKRANLDTLDNELKSLIKNDEMNKAFEHFLETKNAYNPLLDKMIEYAKANNDEEARKGLDPNSDAGKTAAAELAAIDDMQVIQMAEAKATSENNTKSSNTAVFTMIVIIAIGMLAAVILGIFISGIISRPVKNMVEAANKIAIGDVNVNVTATTKDEIGDLLSSFSNMIENIREQAFAVEKISEGDLTVKIKVKSDKDLLGMKLSEMVETNNDILGSINSASEQVAAGAKQVSSSSQALSQGSTEQASSIEEITSSITQIASQTKQNAVNANQANELAISAKENALKGNNRMQEMVKAMTDINDSSSNISKIIKVIDEIAFQTNILALNAAVEAARAGQHGKGFAVVAEEVRNLAARSANAAKETTAMIEGSIKNVEIGTKIASETAVALNSIVEGVSKAATIVADIAIASNEQATGISQINSAIEQVAQVVQTNSATAEECASASEELSSQADLLKGSVSRFKLKKSQVQSIINGENVSPEVIKAIEGILNKKNSPIEPENVRKATKAIKTKISLTDTDYGKY